MTRPITQTSSITRESHSKALGKFFVRANIDVTRGHQRSIFSIISGIRPKIWHYDSQKEIEKAIDSSETYLKFRFGHFEMPSMVKRLDNTEDHNDHFW